jgi:hypothetical protein
MVASPGALAPKAQQSLTLIQDNSLTSPTVTTQSLQIGLKVNEHRGGETLREDVGELRCHRDMEDADLTDGHLLSNKIKINLHMLGALMLNGVGG